MLGCKVGMKNWQTGQSADVIQLLLWEWAELRWACKFEGAGLNQFFLSKKEVFRVF